jgi:hypothetical protein
MKPATLAAKTTVQQDHAVHALPRVLAEWDMNRFSDINEIWASPAQISTDPDYASVWDINSLGLPNRPRTGIAKARMDEPSVMTLDQYRDYPTAARFYPADPSDLYKYWSSADRSHLAQGIDGGYAFDAPIVISLAYQQPVDANKIVVGFETSYAKPVSYSVAISPDGVNFYNVSSNPVMESDGTVTLWLNGDHQWDSVPFYAATTAIQGVQVTVSSINQPYMHLDVLQLGARLENDLTDFVIKYDVQMQMSDRSYIVPLGKASSNEAKITLSNIDGRFNNDNVNSLYYGIIDKRVKMTIDLCLDATKHGGTTKEYIREFTGWVDDWGTQTQATTEVQLKDSSVFLQDMIAPKVFFEGSTVGGIIWQMMDRIGMSNYSYVRREAEAGTVVPYYWPDAQKFLWNELQDLAEASQYAVWFDQNDILQIRSRESLFNVDDPVVWNFDAVPNAAKLPDIVDMTVDKSMLTNHVVVTWKPTHFSDFNNGFPKMEQVWSPTSQADVSGGTTSTGTDPATGVGIVSAPVQTSGTEQNTDVVLRSSPLAKDLLSTDDSFWIAQDQAAIWDFHGTVNIRGEMLSYKGKEYVYYDVHSNPQTIIVNSLTDKKNIDKQMSSEFLSWKNYFTGRFMITARALYGSLTPAKHPSQAFSYTGYVSNWANNVNYRWDAGIKYQPDGYAQLTNVTSDGQTYWTSKHPQAVLPQNGTTAVMYGTSIRFPNLGDAIPGTRADGTPDIPTIWDVGGLHFAGGSGRTGLYLEVIPTSYLDDNKYRIGEGGPGVLNEISLVVQPASGAAQRLICPNNTVNKVTDASGNQAANDAAGWMWNILYDVWYDFDVKMSVLPDQSVNIYVFVNSVVAGWWNIDAATARAYGISFQEGRFGTFVRGNSKVDYDYLYAVNTEDNQPDPDSTGFLDLVQGDFTSGYIERDWKFGYNYGEYTAAGGYVSPPGTLGQPVPSMLYRSNAAYDEYGSQVHECRQWSVQFSDSNVPCEHSFLYITNTAQAQVLYYNSNAYGAEFMIANAARQNCVLNGEDSYTLGTGNTVNHTMFIYGRQLYQDDDQTLEKRKDLSIRRRGQAQVTFNSKFIQTQEMADGLGEWITRLFGQGVEEATLNVFGNPFIELGDLVTINYPMKNIAPGTHKYFVVDVQSTFDSGYKTEVVLRRANIDI